jgi:hypothetical protein
MFAATVAWVLLGCVMGDKISQIRPGMTKAQVVAKLGSPDGYKQGEHGEEVLRYSNRISTGWSGDRGDYFVTLRNGVVVEYGAETIRPGPKPIVIIPPPPIQ